MEVGGGCGTSAGAAASDTASDAGCGAAAAADYAAGSTTATAAAAATAATTKSKHGHPTTKQQWSSTATTIRPRLTNLRGNLHLWRAHALRPIQPGICLPPGIHVITPPLATFVAFRSGAGCGEYDIEFVFEL